MSRRPLVRSTVSCAPRARRPRALSCLALLLAIAISGCGARDDRPPTYAAGGVVLFRGQPQAGAQVSFLAYGASRAALGTTDNEGKFTLSTFAPGDGAVAGEHFAAVSLPPSTPPIQSYAESDYAATMQAHRQAVAQNSQLPPRYANPRTSGLRFTISAEGPNQFRLELVD